MQGFSRSELNVIEQWLREHGDETRSLDAEGGRSVNQRLNDRKERNKAARAAFRKRKVENTKGWRSRFAEKYRAYMRLYMRAKRHALRDAAATSA